MGAGAVRHGPQPVIEFAVTTNSRQRILVCTPTIHRFAGRRRLDNLRRNIESALAQTHTDFEQHILNDRCRAGDDCALCRETAELCRAFAARDSRIRFTQLERHGDNFGYASRNRAIQESDAPLIAYLDDDNWWEPEHLRSLHNALQQARAAFAFSASNVRNHRGRIILRRRTARPYFTGIDLNEILHRRELIERCGAWNLTYNADWEAVHAWLQAGEPFVTTGLFTSNYSIRPGLKSRLLFYYSYGKNRLRSRLTASVAPPGSRKA